MTTENENIEITIDPQLFDTRADISFHFRQEPKCVITLGCIDAVDQMEDLLNKFDALDTEFKTQVMSVLGNFIQEHGFKIVETGGIVPQ